MSNSLAKQFSTWSLIKFAIPNIIMMIFLSMYTIVDGAFISAFVGTTALSAVNIVYPATSLEMAVGIMLATGGSAIIARKLGEQKAEEARKDFTLLIVVAIVIGVITMIAGVVWVEDIVRLLGASDIQFQMCVDYIRILFLFAPFFFLQTMFQVFFVTAGKPMLGLIAVAGSGVTNIILDYVFLGPLDMGIKGAAYATCIGYCITALAGLLYFFFVKKGSLYFVRPAWHGRMLWRACGNGSSEMVSNLANAVTTFLFNMVFMRYYGEDGVAAITIVLYFQFVFSAVYLGYSMGVAPVISYKYGNQDVPQLKKIIKSSLLFIGIASVLSYLLSVISIDKVLMVFTPKGSNVYDITEYGFGIYALSFLLMGIGIFASAMFTAFSDGKVSAIISFARTFVFLAGSILLLPMLIGANGAWWAVVVAEGLGVIVAIWYLLRMRHTYYYGL